MFFMNANETFVVVDLETTGQSVAKGGRIIQIGMTFIKQRKIVDHFESFVNPGQLIARNIQQLTHISQKEVKNAPYFEEIAPLLQNLLKDTVIIAHNINFDYPYLNDEFIRTGFPELNLAAIDTVQLAQILLPTAPGYRLVDLTTYLNITLNNAHRANADAHATALLFLKLWQKAAQLPRVVLQRLQYGTWPLLRQTQDFLKVVKTKNQDHNLDIINKIALTKPLVQVSSKNNKSPKYPHTPEDKRRLFGRWMTEIEAQNNLMNRVNTFISKRHDGVLTVLTAPRIGKTVGYLVPLLLDSKSQPTLLLTNDESLQKQQFTLSNKLAKLLDIKLNTAILYDATEYIDVDRFTSKLNDTTDTTQKQFLKARLLVWLTETKTGLLHEIQVGLNQTEHVLDIQGDTESLFFKRAKANADYADVLIMNFNSYFNQYDELLAIRNLTKWPVVVMETPSQFVADIKNYFHVELNLTQFQNTLKTLMHHEIPGFSHKQRLFIRQSTAETLKLIKQVYRLGNANTSTLHKVERLLTLLHQLAEVVKLSDTTIPSELRQVNDQLVKIKRLLKQNEVTSNYELQTINDQSQMTVTFDILPQQIYQKKFMTHIHKLLVVSEYLDNHVSNFLGDTPKGITVEREFIRNKSKPVQVVQLQKSSPLIHLQALTQKNVGEILIILPNLDRVNHWYQKSKHAMVTSYNLVAEGITGSLEKIQRQSHAGQGNIIMVTPKIFSTMWLRDQELPTIVIVPERIVWQPVSRLALVLTQMQRHNATLLITQLNAMQRNHFKSQIDVVHQFDPKKNLVTQYSQILKDI